MRGDDDRHLRFVDTVFDGFIAQGRVERHNCDAVPEGSEGCEQPFRSSFGKDQDFVSGSSTDRQKTASEGFDASDRFAIGGELVVAQDELNEVFIEVVDRAKSVAWRPS